MQLIHLPQLRQATSQEREALQRLAVMQLDYTSQLSENRRLSLIKQLLVLLHHQEKQLLPFFHNLTADEFDWMAWLVSPALAAELVRQEAPLPALTTREKTALPCESLPQALGAAWALCHLASLTRALLPGCSKQGLNSRVLQQLEALAQIYCASSSDHFAARKAARRTLQQLHQQLDAWEKEVQLPLAVSA
ncbi:hypothetical protein [Marinospirillum perlucidum]|uniref:hypothetical protein n=1 Tax=Marinospirillum perlucidum TaxID=1982602 RepID=UPI000DF3F15E|nr:hypothetical protein [Marinospirillum perlucidum]